MPGWAVDGVRKILDYAVGDIKMEGQSLIDSLVGWGPNSAEVLSGHAAAHPRNKSSLDQPIVASWDGWSSVQVQYDRAGLAISHPNSRRARLFDWLLVACPFYRGMALKRQCALAVRQSWEAVPGPWGSYQVMIKVLPGCRPARAGLDDLTGRRAISRMRQRSPRSLGWWYHKQRQVSVIEMSDGQGNSLTAAG